jgi:hypothetical protein
VLFKDKRPLIFNEKYMAIPAGVTANRNAVNVFMAVEPDARPRRTRRAHPARKRRYQSDLYIPAAHRLEQSGFAEPVKAPRTATRRWSRLIGNGTTGTISQDFDSSTGTISAAGDDGRLSSATPTLPPAIS